MHFSIACLSNDGFIKAALASASAVSQKTGEGVYEQSLICSRRGIVTSLDLKTGKDFITFWTIYSYSIGVVFAYMSDLEEKKGPGPDWNCACFGDELIKPCAEGFKEAYTCFHYSKAQPKGSECIPHMQKYKDCAILNRKDYPEKFTKSSKQAKGEQP